MKPEQMTELQSSISNSDFLAIDTETNWTDSYKDRYCMGVSIYNGTDGWYIPVRHSDWLLPADNITIPPDLFRGVRCPIIFHNAKFDLAVLYRMGVQVPTNQMYDTMLMHHYIDENPPHDLDQLGYRQLGIRKEKDLRAAMKQKWDDMPAQTMAPYSIQDCRVTADLYFHFLPEFQEFEKLWISQDRPFLLLLEKIESKGIRINRELAAELEAACDLRMREIRQQLGFDPAKPSQLHPKLFSDPPDGLGLTPASYTSNLKPQVRIPWLQSLGHPVTALCVEYKILQKQKSSYFTAYLNLTTRDYDLLHPNFKLHGTVTGRMSCENPNLQQVPRSSRVKQLFIPEEGKELWELDFKNMEMRLAAVYAQEPTLLQVFKEEGDVHGTVANDLGIDRQVAKTVNFLIIYGGQEKALSQQIGKSVKYCAEIIDRYRGSYPTIFNSMEAAEETAIEKGEVRYWSGRKRHFHYQNEERKAFNSIIQGGSFEIVKRAMLRLDQQGADIRNQVHDSVWVQLDDPSIIPDMEREMADWTEEAFGLKFSVESKRLN